MRILTLLLISTACFAQSKVFRADNIIEYSKTENIKVTDGMVYKWTLPDTATARFFDPGSDEYEMTVTAKKKTTVPPLIASSIDDADATYTGVWIKNANQSWTQIFYNKTASYSSNPGAYVSATYTGGRFEIWSEKRFNHGICEVWMQKGSDPAVKLAAVDLYDVRTDNNSQKVYDSGELPIANYKITFALIGKSPLATSGDIFFDRFVVYK